MRALLMHRSQIIGEPEAFTEYSFSMQIFGIEALQGAHIGGTNINAVRCDLEKLMTSEEYHSSWLRTTTKAATIPTTITPTASLLAKKKYVPDLYPYPSILLWRHPLLWAKHSSEFRFPYVIKTVVFGGLTASLATPHPDRCWLVGFVQVWGNRRQLERSLPLI